MILIHDCIIEDRRYSICLTEKTFQKSREAGLHKGIFIGAASRIVSRSQNDKLTYFYAEHNILFYVKITDNRDITFIDLKRLNIFGSGRLFKLKEPIYEVSNPSFFKSYEDGKKVYLNENLPLKLTRLRIPPHHISLKSLRLPTGSYSMYTNGVIVDFKHTDSGDFYITDLLKPDFINFGLAVFRN